MTPEQVMEDAIVRHAGLSEFDREWVEEEVAAIIQALHKWGYVIEEGINQ